ncbi:AMP-binding protein [Micromonospora sp. KLBMP9576]|uniref:AMP-binding protein n=1 Tax=Micromonospora sp. KLBMP9576 TaxID=3424769 RepID=UPI003D8FBED3
MRTVVDAILDRPGDGALTVLTGSGETTRGTWAEVDLLARRIAGVLRRDGLGPGCRVGLLADTGVELIATLQGVWLVGGAVTVLPVPPRRGGVDRHELTRAVAADAGFHLVVAADEVPAGAVPPGTPLVSLAALVRRAAGSTPTVVTRPDPTDLAVLQYTSGSTRRPRGVPVSHAHLAANLRAIRDATDHERDHPGPLLSWLPLYHDMGLVGALTLTMTCGCAAVLVSPAAFVRQPAVWLAAVRTYRPTWSGGPNFAFALLTRLLRRSPEADLSSLRHLVSGGEPVDASTMAGFLDEAARHGLDPRVFTPAYGLAESTLAVTCPPRGRGLRVDRVDPDVLAARGIAMPATEGGRQRALVRLGRPVPGASVRIVDQHTGVALGDRRVGHIEVGGPSVVGRYWGEPAGPPAGWLRTGDLGYVVDGELVVCGREKDLVIVGGRNVHPADVEAAAAVVPGVRAGGVVAFGVPSPDGERLVVAVETTDIRPEVVRRAVRAAVVDRIGVAPAEVRTVPPRQLPKTTSGKLRRAEARRRYQRGEWGRTTG